MSALGASGKWSIVFKILACFLVVTWTVAGCGFGDAPPLKKAQSVQRKELVGSWQGDYAAFLTLREDGTFAAVKLHTSFTKGAGIKILGKELLEGSGTWSFGEYGAGPEVNIDFAGGGGATLKVVQKGEVRVLSAWVGDGDSALLVKGPAPTS
ncbi:hypothetical protein ACFWAR_02215 [Streptomyces sp. NPDC059917]|uniref:hypothetical protein n=1 Tax=Streptomyces sp. NPDC059917 TaxID=3347002 RepID=UPI00366483C5